MKIIAACNIKGGVGKTTTATTLAHIISRQGKRTLLVDMDPQGSSTSTFSDKSFSDEFQEASTRRLEYSVKTLLTDVEMDVHKCIRHTSYPNLDIIEADFSLIEAEREIVLDDSAPQQNRLKMHLDKIRNEYDYCFIDCGANAALININALVASDEVIIPTTADGYSLQQIVNTMEMIENVTEFNITLNVIGIVCVRWEEKQTNKLSAYLLNGKYGELVLPIKIRKSKVCEELTYEREPLLSYDSGKNKSNATNDYIKLAGYILAPNRKTYVSKKLLPILEFEDECNALIKQRNALKRKADRKNTRELKLLDSKIKQLEKDINEMRKGLL